MSVCSFDGTVSRRSTGALSSAGLSASTSSVVCAVSSDPSPSSGSTSAGLSVDGGA